jgi:hypothetical protein
MLKFFQHLTKKAKPNPETSSDNYGLWINDSNEESKGRMSNVQKVRHKCFPIHPSR